MVRRFDPERRERIIAAAIESIAEEGVAGTSHRRVADRADVPLGSMTYHFTGIDELLTEAFTRVAATISEVFAARLEQASSRENAVEAVVDLIHGDLQRDRREQALTYELYTLAARRSEFRTITQNWMRASRAALEHHFSAPTARAIDAYIEGAALHIALDPEPQTREFTKSVVAALAASDQTRATAPTPHRHKELGHKY